MSSILGGSEVIFVMTTRSAVIPFPGRSNSNNWSGASDAVKEPWRLPPKKNWNSALSASGPHDWEFVKIAKSLPGPSENGWAKSSIRLPGVILVPRKYLYCLGPPSLRNDPRRLAAEFPNPSVSNGSVKKGAGRDFLFLASF